MIKKIILTSATFLFVVIAANAQNDAYNKKYDLSDYALADAAPRNLYFEVKGRGTRVITKETLSDAKRLRDFIDGYPTNWISDYVSVEVWTTCMGNAMKAVSANDVLNKNQRNILATADLGSDVVVNVLYKSTNAITNAVEDDQMHVVLTVVPKTQAEYVGGDHLMKKYLQENIITKISSSTPKEFQKGTVAFTVDETGEIVDVKISKASGDAQTDKLLINAINKMPKWKPAENSKGVKVKQGFVFSVGNSGC